MEIYLVGGAVRDALLGLPVTDHDWVVVGASAGQLLELGYAPVGKDFPVFLHPVTHEEFALARTERKTAPGYRGFEVHASPEVTLEEDLARRDLTINAIAVRAIPAELPGRFDLDFGRVVDPWGGRADLQARLLRHVTESFREDPVRILRVARFAARFPEFSVAPATLQLMRDMVAHGEAAHLVSERVWQELARGLMAICPSRMFALLRSCGAEAWELGGYDFALERMPVIDLAASLGLALPLRFACLCQRLPLARLRAFCEQLRVPLQCRELAELALGEPDALQRSAGLDATGLVQLLRRCDAFRRPGRFHDALQVWACDALAGAGARPDPGPAQQWLAQVLAAAQALDTRVVAEQARQVGAVGPQVGEMILSARVAAVAAFVSPLSK